MAEAGFEAIGVDFAKDTVAQAKETYPGIDVREGDVRALDFPDDYFDGYWSIGVIEHFWDGYDEIMSEAARVLKPGGFLFLTAPWFSPYRKSKARDGGYGKIAVATEPESFYQFALGRDEVCDKLALYGLELQSWRGRVSEISMRSDMISWRRSIDWLLGSRGSIVKRVCRRVVARGMDPYCGHSFLAVARRRVD
jgi:SAM-dependent methyltransferase